MPGSTSDGDNTSIPDIGQNLRAFQQVPALDIAYLHTPEQKPAQVRRVARLPAMHAGKEDPVSAKYIIDSFNIKFEFGSHIYLLVDVNMGRLDCSNFHDACV